MRTLLTGVLAIPLFALPALAESSIDQASIRDAVEATPLTVEQSDQLRHAPRLRASMESRKPIGTVTHVMLPFADYQFTGWAFDVLDNTHLNRVAGCTQLNLLASPSEIHDYINNPGTELLSLLKTSGQNVFECAGENLSEPLRFIVRSELGRLTSSMANRSKSSLELRWEEASNSFSTRLAELNSSEHRTTDIADRFVAEATHILLNTFVTHQKDLRKTLHQGAPSIHSRAIQGTVQRETLYNIGGWYDGINVKRPVQYDSGWLDNNDLVVGGNECSGSPVATQPYNFLAATQWETGNEQQDDCGHMLGRQLGGSGRYNGPTGTTSVFSQNRTVNRGAFANYEGKVRNLIACTGNCSAQAWVRLIFSYNGNASGNKRADQVRYKVYCPTNDAVCKQRMTNNFGTHPVATSTYMDFQNPYSPNIWKDENEYHAQQDTSIGTGYAGYNGTGYRYLWSPNTSYVTYLYESPQATTLTLFLRVYSPSGTPTSVNIYNGLNGTNLVGTYSYPATGAWAWGSISMPLQVGSNKIKIFRPGGTNTFRIDDAVLQ